MRKGRPMAEVHEQLGENLRMLRGQAHLSQEELGRLCGKDRSYIGSIENGGNITIGNLSLLAEALDVEPWMLLYPLE